MSQEPAIESTLKRPEEVREALRRALEEPPPGLEQKSWGRQLFEQFLEWLDGMGWDLGIDPNGETLSIVMYVLLFSLLLVLVWYAVRLTRQILRVRAMQASGAAEEPSETVEARCARLLAQADAAQAAGDHRLALRLYFWALVVGLSRTGKLEYRDAWTGREMLQRSGMLGELRNQLAPLVREVDALSFGGGRVEAADSARMRERCLQWLELRA